MVVAPLVEAEGAQLALGDVEAAAAPRDAVLGILDRVREALGVERVDLQEVKRDALRRLRADAGQASELVDQRLHDALVDVHGLSEPPRPPSIEPRSRPPVTAPS